VSQGHYTIPNMVLAALIVGIVALVVAILGLPAAFQRLWGRPKISLERGTGNLADAVFLECKIWNEPINNILLKAMGVNREAADDLTALIEIKEAGSNKVIIGADFVICSIAQMP